MHSQNAILPMMKKVSWHTYILRDNFPVDDPAPIASPRTCEPGPGTLTSSFGATWEIVSSYLRSIHTTQEQAFTTPTYALSSGQAAYIKSIGLKAGATTRSWIVYWYATGAYGFRIDDTMAYVYIGGTLQAICPLIAAANAISVLCMRMASGQFLLFMTGDRFASWTLVAVSRVLDAAANRAIFFNNTAANKDIQMDEFSAVQFTNALAADYGICTSYSVAALANATATHTANGHIEATRTLGAGEVYDLSFRRTDDDNRWILRANETANTIAIIERNAGTETSRGSVAVTLNAGTAYRFYARFYGNEIYITAVNIAVGYASAVFNNTATGAQTSHDVSNFAAWPADVSAYVDF